jgi:outer membrane lipoprotein SlyB
MHTINKIAPIVGIVMALGLGACADMTNPTPTSGAAANTPVAVGVITARPGFGVVQSVESVARPIEGIGSTGIGAGTVVGGVVGGVVGSQVGEGTGKTAATVLGAAAGAYAGHELEKRQQQNSPNYRIRVRMDDGSTQTVTQTTNPNIRVGDRVRIDNGVALRS